MHSVIVFFIKPKTVTFSLLGLPNNSTVTFRKMRRFIKAVGGRHKEGRVLPFAFLCGRMYLGYSEESEPEEIGNTYISTIWNDSLSVAVGNTLMLTLYI